MKVRARWHPVTFLFFCLVQIVIVQAQPSEQLLAHHVPVAVTNGQARPLGQLSATQSMDLSIVLPLRNQSELTNLLQRLYDPSSSNYRQFLSVEEFTRQFGPTEDDYQKVVDFAQANGFIVRSSAANRLVVSICGRVDQVQKAFNVTMRTYRHPTENRTFFSPDREPSVAAGVPIAHIAGLNNFSTPRPAVEHPSASRIASAQSLQGSGPWGGYLSSDMRAAYYGGSSLTGAGQTVGLLQMDGYDIADVVNALDGTASATATGSNYVLTYTPSEGGQTYTIPIHNVLLDGATGKPGQFQPPADDSEQTLDIAQVVGMAPGVSQIRVYIGSVDSDILNAIASENIAKEVNISWGWTPDDPSIDEPFFKEFAAQGQSVFVASGDDGAYSAKYPYYYPAEDPWVTAVGGTTLTTTGAGGAWEYEGAWDRSGGGVSPDRLKIPEWQSGLATAANGGSNIYRNVPDVAMEADFDNYACDMGTCSTGWGGTSFASPRWAAFAALLNQQLANSGGKTLGFFNLPLYAAADGASYQDTLHDISSGNNNHVSGYSYSAVSGFDLVTGWGSPNGQSLIDQLVPPAATPTFTVTPGIYTSAQILAIDDSTPGAAIYYTTNGATPSTGSTLYRGSITVASSETIQAIAIASGYSPSTVASASYTIDLPPNSGPILTSLSPAYINADSPAFTLTVNGSGFTKGSTVYWGASALSTQVLSDTQLSAQVSASDIATAGARTLTVETPAPGGNTSNEFLFEVDTASSGSSGAPSFSATSAKVDAGAVASFPVTLSSSASAMSVACLNLPAEAGCSYSSATGAVTVSTSSATPAGTYQITVVFFETLPETSSAFMILPIFLLPVVFVRKRLAAKGILRVVGIVVFLLACVSTWTGCDASKTQTSVSPSNPAQQVTRSGEISLIVR